MNELEECSFVKARFPHISTHFSTLSLMNWWILLQPLALWKPNNQAFFLPFFQTMLMIILDLVFFFILTKMPLDWREAAHWCLTLCHGWRGENGLIERSAVHSVGALEQRCARVHIVASKPSQAENEDSRQICRCFFSPSTVQDTDDTAVETLLVCTDDRLDFWGCGSSWKTMSVCSLPSGPGLLASTVWLWHIIASIKLLPHLGSIFGV